MHCRPQALRTVGVVSQGCEPDCSGATAGDKVPDPTDCGSYYLCLSPNEPSVTPFACADDDPSKPYFDSINNRCSNKDDHCVTPCVPSFCHLTCTEAIDYIADTENCSVFYICLPNGISPPQYCSPEAPFFDSTHQRCVAENTVCCDPKVNVQVPDPYDCTSFYLCTEIGPVDAEGNSHFTCPNGENYNATLGDCVPDAECKILCAGRKGSTSGMSGLHDM